jgi:hypothetical protein
MVIKFASKVLLFYAVIYVIEKLLNAPEGAKN